MSHLPRPQTINCRETRKVVLLRHKFWGEILGVRYLNKKYWFGATVKERNQGHINDLVCKDRADPDRRRATRQVRVTCQKLCLCRSVLHCNSKVTRPFRMIKLIIPNIAILWSSDLGCLDAFRVGARAVLPKPRTVDRKIYNGRTPYRAY